MMRFLTVIFGTAVLIGVIFFGVFLWDGYLLRPSPQAEIKQFEVASGESLASISRRLEAKGLIKSPWMFRRFAVFTGRDEEIRAGRFSLQANMSYNTILRLMVQAGPVDVRVTFPEGFTKRQILERLQTVLSNVTQEDWDKWSGAQSPLLQEEIILKSVPLPQGLEGYLFPDTYDFSPDADAQAVVEKTVLTLKRRLAENNIVFGENLVLPNGMTLHQVLTLASIVEKEVRLPEDMRLVAGIFLQRLHIGMAIQADSTINYFTGGTSASVSLDDTDIDSPYNTYKYPGLPPGPISNPGMNAINAVLNPRYSSWYYFLTAPDGEVKYARTLEEHIRNRALYLK